ncbi:MAG: V-type ATP synthase subunit F [Clostridium sp.]|jgi:V/A-type H+-transporting ATPase subunit F|nr:V-type ATP synthase subunit F [Clostridium sp.]
MYKIAVIGDYDSIYGFAALGLDTFPADGAEETEQVFRRLASGDYAVIYITEAAAAQISRTVERYRENLLPAVILIPGVSGNTGQGIEEVKKSVEQAVGSDILFGGV